MHIIGVDGVGSGRDAYKKLQDRASTVQVCSMLVYEGPGLASCIRKELEDLLLENGYRSVDDIVEADHKDTYWRMREESVQRLMQERGRRTRRLSSCEPTANSSIPLMNDCIFSFVHTHAVP